MTAIGGSEQRIGAAQDRILADYLRRVVAPYSEVHGEELRRRSVTSRAGLHAVPPRTPGQVGDPGRLVLRPSQQTISASGDLALVARLWWAQLMRRQGSFNHHVLEPSYKPVQWCMSVDVPLGYSAEDLERLAEIGRASLAHAGLTQADSIVSVGLDHSTVAFWQLSLGARRSGTAIAHVAGRADEVAVLGPTVVAGPLGSILSVMGASPRVRAVIVTDGPLDDDARGRATDVARGASVIDGWSPAGARSMWLRCPGGAFHTWPATEVVEVDTDGHLLWTPLQWKGSVLLRTRTGVAATVYEGRCEGCVRTGARVVPTPPVPSTSAARRLRSRPASPRRRTKR